MNARQEMTTGFALSKAGPNRWSLGLVVLLHLLLALLLMSLYQGSGSKQSSKTELIQMRLLPLPRESSKPAKTIALEQRPRQAPGTFPVSPPAPLQVLATEKQQNSVQASNVISATERPALPASAPEPSYKAALQLGLPSTAAERRPNQAALSDPRSNTQRPDFGERMAAALGSDPSLREEIIGPGHRRFRQGSSCLDVNDARDSQINPFDERTRGNKLISPCKK